MELASDTKNYELAYHLNPDIEESQVMASAKDLENMLVAQGGTILISKEPKRKHLSYPIKQKHYAYFGLFEFNGLPEIIIKINEDLKLKSQVLRYLLITKDLTDQETRSLGTERPRPKMRTHEATAIPRSESEKDKKEEIKPEQIEKELEEVLSKL